MIITSFGAADTVTGSRHLVEWGGTRVLLDAGLFQGYKLLRERNWAPAPAALLGADAVILSHAHLDHSGWLPALVKQGFKGPVYASPATRDLAEVLLQDSAHLQEEDARRANRWGYSRHDKALPLYTRADAQRAIARIKTVPPGRPFRVGGRAGNLEALLTPVGHLLGACAVSLSLGGERLVYSGDLGRQGDLLMPPPQTLDGADCLLVESTYGDRLHLPLDAQAQLGDIIRRCVRRGGSVLLPAFAVGRAQALLLVLQRLKAAGDIPADLPIFLDSPMAIQATELYLKHRRALRVTPAEISRLTDGVRMTPKAQQSARISTLHYPHVVISASGMATGGRVLHHLKAMAPEPKNSVVFAGFQVGGSRGASLVGGAKEVKIHGDYVPVRAEISQLEGFSGHADSDEILRWLRSFRHAPRQTLVVHGEPGASDALRMRIKEELGWAVRVAEHAQPYEC